MKQRRKLGHPSLPENKQTADAIGTLVCLLLLQWREPPGAKRSLLARKVRQWRVDLYEIAAGAGLSGKRMEGIARRAFLDIKNQTEQLN